MCYICSAGWTCPWIVMCRADYAFSEIQWRFAALSFLSGIHLMLIQCSVVSCMEKRAVSLTPSPGNELHHGPHWDGYEQCAPYWFNSVITPRAALSGGLKRTCLIASLFHINKSAMWCNTGQTKKSPKPRSPPEDTPGHRCRLWQE